MGIRISKSLGWIIPQPDEEYDLSLDLIASEWLRNQAPDLFNHDETPSELLRDPRMLDYYLAYQAMNKEVDLYNYVTSFVFQNVIHLRIKAFGNLGIYRYGDSIDTWTHYLVHGNNKSNRIDYLPDSPFPYGGLWKDPDNLETELTKEERIKKNASILNVPDFSKAEDIWNDIFFDVEKFIPYIPYHVMDLFCDMFPGNKDKVKELRPAIVTEWK